jgi:hypothetical protein
VVWAGMKGRIVRIELIWNITRVIGGATLLGSNHLGLESQFLEEYTLDQESEYLSLRILLFSPPAS